MHKFLKMNFFQLARQRQHVDAVGCRTFFGGLICMFVVDILQVPSGCNRLVVGAVHALGSPRLRVCLTGML
jgi:hypothetical protein